MDTQLLLPIQRVILHTKTCLTHPITNSVIDSVSISGVGGRSKIRWCFEWKWGYGLVVVTELTCGFRLNYGFASESRGGCGFYCVFAGFCNRHRYWFWF